MMTRENVAKLAQEAGFQVENNHVFANSEIGPAHALCTEAVNKFAAIVEQHVRRQLTEEVLMHLLKSDLMMPESEVDEDSDDYFKSPDFRYSMNNTVKATLFEVLQVIKEKS